MRSQYAARTCDLDSGFDPYFGIIAILLYPLSHMLDFREVHQNYETKK